MITTKKEFLELYNAGRLGNKIRSWPSLAALKSSDYRGSITIRSRQTDWKTMYYVPQDRLEAILAKEGRLRGFASQDLYFNESAPDDRLLLQGEYHNDHTRYLMYSRAQLAMKDALALPLDHDYMGMILCGFRVEGPTEYWQAAAESERQHRHESEGLKTEMLLRANMNANSWEDFNILRDEYPGHIIEFGCYDCELGSVTGRNTLMWEVRHY